MSKAKRDSGVKPRRPPLTPESNESEMISMAMDLARKQLQEGTASSQVITHFLKLGPLRAELETQKLERENELLRAKTDAIQSTSQDDEKYDRVIRAIRDYRGTNTDDDGDY